MKTMCMPGVLRLEEGINPLDQELHTEDVSHHVNPRPPQEGQ